jgi:uncharacterized protein involved in cysteine biosynthesis
MMSSFIPDLFIPIVSITALLLAVAFFHGSFMRHHGQFFGRDEF